MAIKPVSRFKIAPCLFHVAESWMRVDGNMQAFKLHKSSTLSGQVFVCGISHVGSHICSRLFEPNAVSPYATVPQSEAFDSCSDQTIPKQYWLYHSSASILHSKTPLIIDGIPRHISLALAYLLLGLPYRCGVMRGGIPLCGPVCILPSSGRR